jgi:hypothetical protein
MKKTILSILLGIGCQTSSWAQGQSQKVFTADIDHFWQAYDSCRTTTDSLRQLYFIRTLYIDRGTPGLHGFMKARNFSAEGWVSLIRTYPKFWNSIRPHTLRIKGKVPLLEEYIGRLRVLYPPLKPAAIYFTIGGLGSGGTTKDSMVFMGSELDTGDPSIDVSEFTNHWVENVFKEENMDYFIPLSAHEYIHTQQYSEGIDVLSQSIVEGSADFVAELTMGTPISTYYMKYGSAHEQELKEEFKKEMFGINFPHWLYNGTNANGTVGDLGYFMGYSICKSYYRQATDKKPAIKEIIELHASDTTAVLHFLQRSGYYNEPIDRQALVKEANALLPFVTGLRPFSSGDTTVDAAIQELTIVFSEPMAKNVSINYGAHGSDAWPFSTGYRFSDDKRSLLMKVNLQPGHTYEFVVTVNSFKSEKGFPLREEYPVTFRTNR